MKNLLHIFEKKKNYKNSLKIPTNNFKVNKTLKNLKKNIENSFRKIQYFIPAYKYAKLLGNNKVPVNYSYFIIG